MEEDKTTGPKEETASPSKRKRDEDKTQDQSPSKKLTSPQFDSQEVQSNFIHPVVREEIIPATVHNCEDLKKQVHPLDQTKLLLSILSHLNFQDLKSCRVVNKTWKIHADTTIFRKDRCRIQFKNNDHFLTQFDILKKASTLPTGDFLFYNLNGEQIKVLSYVFGPRIQELSIYYDFEGINQMINHILIFLKLHLLYRNLEKLTVQDLWSISVNCCWLNLNLQSFPRLKQLTVNKFGNNVNNLRLQRDSILYQLILNASNLERIENLCLDGSTSLPLKFWTDRINLIKKITIPGIGQNLSVQDIKYFADLNPKLEHLSIEELDREEKQFQSEVFRIIRSSRNSLQTLEFGSPFTLPNKMEILPLVNLTTLSLLVNSRMSNLQYFFNEVYLSSRPNGNDLQKLCPRLKTIRFRFLLNDGENFNEYKFFFYSPLKPPFGTFTNNLKSVENLELLIRGDHFVNLRLGWLDRCQELFPNVKRVTMDPRINLVSNFVKLSQLWPNLISIRMNLNMWSLYQNEHGIFPVSLDRVLTGLPEQLCSFLESPPPNHQIVVSLDEILRVRKFPALYSFPDLKKFEIVVAIRHYEEGFRGFPMSFVAFLFGANLNPNLKPVIRFDFNSPKAQSFWELMEPFAPYVDFAHEPEEID